MADIDGLKEFTGLMERDDAPFFAGRAEQFQDVGKACSGAMAKARAGANVTSATRVFHGAPGAGKTALLAEIAKRCSAWDDAPVPVALQLSHLEDEGRLARRIAEGRLKGGSLGSGRTETRSVDGGVNLDVASAGGSVGESLGAPPASLDELELMFPPAEWPRPMLLMVDEIQNVRPEARLMLDALHNGTHGFPVIPVCAGLGNSIDVLGRYGIGLSGLPEDQVHVIGALAHEEARQAVRKMLAHFAVPRSDAAPDWPGMLAERSGCWPQHLHNGMRALAQWLLDGGGRLAAGRPRCLLRSPCIHAWLGTGISSGCSLWPVA